MSIGCQQKPARLPEWLRRPVQTGNAYAATLSALKQGGLHTVCEDAKCPNRHECWNHGTATFMILGTVCTRDCRFCAVATGRPAPPDPGEPQRVAEAAARLGLRHVVVTSVTRDDLPDGGAAAFARTIQAIKARVPGATVEVLVPDFQGSAQSLSTVLEAAPAVFNHNIETVERLQGTVRPGAAYGRSLGVLRYAAGYGGGPVKVKSGIMLGLGETDGEVLRTLEDLYAAGVRLLTIGQYLAPSRAHLHTRRFVAPKAFEEFGQAARRLGFEEVAAGPLVRSSYRAAAMAKE